ncbi:MAG TPA: protein kinase [Chloroflexota bacterium]
MVVDEESHILQTDLSSYEVYRRVAGGGFGTVHFGRDLSSNKPVAIKRLHSHLAYEPELVRRFEQEAMRLRDLHHINIVQVLDQGTDGGNVPFIILEWVDGWTLSSVLERRGRLPVEEVAEIASQALAALEVANQHGIVHRDIKPANLMLTAPPEQIVKVMDFGIAKDTLADIPGRQSHTQIGTLAYMAPEQFRGDPVDIRTDLYALGITAYELLMGSRPYRDPLDTGVRPLTEIDPTIAPHLAEVLYRAISKAPARRFQTPGDMLSALAPFRHPSIRLSVPTHTRPPTALWTAQTPSVPPAGTANHSAGVGSEAQVARLEARPVAFAARTHRWRSRNPVLLACLAAVVLTATVAGGFAFAHSLSEPTPSPVEVAGATEVATSLPTATVGGIPTPQPTTISAAQSTVGPTSTSTVTPAPTSSPTLSADDAWQGTLARLDAVWQTDWPMSIQILDGYLQQYPDQQPAIDKLYAALVDYGKELIASGSTDDGIAQLERAQALAPDRQEAQDALVELTPTPAPAATRSLARLPTSTPVRAPTTAPATSATRDSGHPTPPPSLTPARAQTPPPGTGATQDGGGVTSPPTATPPKPATATPVVAPTRVTGGVTAVPTATSVRAATPTRVTAPTRVTWNPTATPARSGGADR